MLAGLDQGRRRRPDHRFSADLQPAVRYEDPGLFRDLLAALLHHLGQRGVDDGTPAEPHVHHGFLPHDHDLQGDCAQLGLLHRPLQRPLRAVRTVVTHHHGHIHTLRLL